MGRSNIDLLARQHTYIERGGGIDEYGMEGMVESFVRGGVSEHKIVLEYQAGARGRRRGRGFRVGLDETVQGGQMTHTTPQNTSTRSADPGDTDQFIRGGVDTLHFLEELVPTVFTVIEIDIIDDIDMGVPGSRNGRGRIGHMERVGSGRYSSIITTSIYMGTGGWGFGGAPGAALGGALEAVALGRVFCEHTDHTYHSGLRWRDLFCGRVFGGSG